MLLSYPYINSHLILKKYENGDYRLISSIENKIDGNVIINESTQYLLSLCDGKKKTLNIIDEVERNFTGSSRSEIQDAVIETFSYLNQIGIIDHCNIPIPSEEIIIKNKSSLDTVYIELTNSCNLKCIHCYNESGSARSNELSTEQMLSLIKSISELGATDVILTGGEPFCRKDIFLLIKEIVKNNLRFSIFSNGLLITPEMAKELKKYNVEFMAISLDGANADSHEKIRGKNTFKRTIDKIKLLKQYDIKVRINHTLTTQTITELEEFMKLMKSLHVEDVYFDRFDDFGRGKEQKELVISIDDGFKVKKLIEKYCDDGCIASSETSLGKIMENDSSKNLCGVGINQCYIKSNGDLSFCPVMSGKRFIIGNVLKRKLGSLWQDAKWDSVRNSTIDNIPGCNDCESKSQCLGGCKAKAYNHYGNFISPDPWACSQFKNNMIIRSKQLA
ncbi:radical SAM protein [Lonsdalea quercina]|uniref:radical SAM protein n=1 Tax=Lonsdalea quercina TaxID=71657 RepID=UPI003974EDEB